MILLFVVMLLGALVICQSLSEMYFDDSIDPNTREWAYARFGTSARALYSMFEITLSGIWPEYARRLFEDVHEGYVAFFVLYIGCVVFAMIKIITALFLKDTLNNAASDANMMMQQKHAEKM